MQNTAAQLLLLDSQEYSSSLLREELLRKGFTRVTNAHPQDDLPRVLAEIEPDVVIFNHHFDHEAGLAVCAEVKRLAAAVPVVAIASAGPAMRLVGKWARETRNVDVVIEKPLSDERFFVVVRDLVDSRRAAREQQARLARLANIVPQAALEAINRNHPGEAEMFEAVVLFTDIRRSTEMIATRRPEDYFATLNRNLSEQTRVLEAGGGSVVKFTGDGVLAVFRGMGRNQLAMRCALALARHESQGILPYGIGLAHGLVLAGFVGDSQHAGQRRQYDVIGATVHLAARLCHLAKAGEVITTRSLLSAARTDLPGGRVVESVAIRGFPQPVECVALCSASSI